MADHAGRIAAVASFGAQSAVLLALMAEVDPTVPVLFLETGQHFPETLEYRHTLAAHLGLTDVRDVRPDPASLRGRDPSGQLHAFDSDACCALRKTEPLERALAPFGAWLNGRRRSQSATRARLPFIEQVGGRIKLNPLADWSHEDIRQEFTRRGLPRHPLAAHGYPSIGCGPCTSAVRPGDDARSGRWAGLAKTECGIHAP